MIVHTCIFEAACPRYNVLCTLWLLLVMVYCCRADHHFSACMVCLQVGDSCPLFVQNALLPISTSVHAYIFSTSQNNLGTYRWPPNLHSSLHRSNVTRGNPVLSCAHCTHSYTIYHMWYSSAVHTRQASTPMSGQQSVDCIKLLDLG